ncbi:unnamed protein product [Echinostoma caproni]|uniref:PDZ domain-containing protein n=1 Tax=Echinostoma caproni TaxID=27848 RepID=A0A183AN87_9TREM|nr:unnamed protein product [Echinostoma caproni]
MELISKIRLEEKHSSASNGMLLAKLFSQWALSEVRYQGCSQIRTQEEETKCQMDDEMLSKENDKRLSTMLPTKCVHPTRLTGDAQSAPCSPMADVRNWYWRRTERSATRRCSQSTNQKCHCTSIPSEWPASQTVRVGRVHSGPQRITFPGQPCGYSTCTGAQLERVHSVRTEKQRHSQCASYLGRFSEIKSCESEGDNHLSSDQRDTESPLDSNVRIGLIENLHRAPRAHTGPVYSPTDSLEATIFKLSKSSAPYVLTADNRIARLSDFDSHLVDTSPATVVHNDLHAAGSGATRTDDQGLQTNGKECMREVTLQRRYPQQRFGMKLDRTESPEKITYIAMILPESPASQAGLRVGDQVLRVNQTDVQQMELDDLLNRIRSADQSLRVVYQSRPTCGLTKTMIIRKQCGKLGIRLRTEPSGLVVDVVLSGSPAASVGLLAGQRLLGLNGQHVGGWDQRTAMNWLRTYPNDTDLAITVLDCVEPRGCTSMHTHPDSSSSDQTESYEQVNGDCGDSCPEAEQNKEAPQCDGKRCGLRRSCLLEMDSTSVYDSVINVAKIVLAADQSGSEN